MGINIPSRLQDIEVNNDNPFANDIFDREKYGTTLKNVVEMYAEGGGVIAINGDWGTGKTTFVRMWSAMLENEGFKTIYFNAWETDYYNDPLSALIAELKDISEENESIRKVCAAAGKIGVNVAKAVIRGFFGMQLGFDSDILKGALDETESIMKDRIADYEEEKQSVKDFKTHLAEYVAKAEIIPLVFIIDELDRCNPHQAVKMLETIKHLFDVPNIVFVLSICRKELENSIRGYYGSESIDACNYLRRFIDIQFELPAPTGSKFCSMLIQYYKFADYFDSNPSGGSKTDDRFSEMAELLFLTYHIDLRTWDRIFAHTRLAAIQVGSSDQVLIELIFFLCFLKITQLDFYIDIRNNKYSMQGLIDALEEKIPFSLLEAQNASFSSKPSNGAFILMLTELLYIYDFTLNEYNGPVLSVGKSMETLNLRTTIIDNSKLVDNIKWLHRALCIDKKLSFFTSKVDLTDNFKL